uniref:Uncharacterized protein n=1 Tax=Cacopsylla melanoneura TaxID=428564 RepID=A0A8D8RG94_9HEMI
MESIFATHTAKWVGDIKKVIFFVSRISTAYVVKRRLPQGVLPLAGGRSARAAKSEGVHPADTMGGVFWTFLAQYFRLSLYIFGNHTAKRQKIEIRAGLMETKSKIVQM